MSEAQLSTAGAKKRKEEERAAIPRKRAEEPTLSAPAAPAQAAGGSSADAKGPPVTKGLSGDRDSEDPRAVRMNENGESRGQSRSAGEAGMHLDDLAQS